MKKALRIILLVVFIGIYVYSGWNLATYYLAAHQQEQTVSGLRKQLVEEDDSYDRNADGILKRYEKLYTDPRYPHRLSGYAAGRGRRVLPAPRFL